MKTKKKTAKPAPKRAQAATAIEVGKAYLFRLATVYDLGKVVAITDDAFVLETASWVADTGRFSDALKSFALNEVEPFVGKAIVFRGSCVDATEWGGQLPTQQK